MLCFVVIICIHFSSVCIYIYRNMVPFLTMALTLSGSKHIDQRATHYAVSSDAVVSLLKFCVRVEHVQI